MGGLTEMDMAELVKMILPSLVVGVLLAWYNRGQAKREEAAREREVRRADGETVQLALLLATAKLSYAVAMALKRGEPNGEVEDGIEQYREAMMEFKQFERKLVAKSGME